MTEGQRESLYCPHCLERALQLKLDRRGRPYSVCMGCSTRAFMPGRYALTGLLRIQPLVEAAARNLRDRSSDEYQEKSRMLLEELAS